jgi:hypothetical protein
MQIFHSKNRLHKYVYVTVTVKNVFEEMSLVFGLRDEMSLEKCPLKDVL